MPNTKHTTKTAQATDNTPDPHEQFTRRWFEDTLADKPFWNLSEVITLGWLHSETKAFYVVPLLRHNDAQDLDFTGDYLFIELVHEHEQGRLDIVSPAWNEFGQVIGGFLRPSDAIRFLRARVALFAWILESYPPAEPIAAPAIEEGVLPRSIEEQADLDRGRKVKEAAAEGGRTRANQKRQKYEQIRNDANDLLKKNPTLTDSGIAGKLSSKSRSRSTIMRALKGWR